MVIIIIRSKVTNQKIIRMYTEQIIAQDKKDLRFCESYLCRLQKIKHKTNTVLNEISRVNELIENLKISIESNETALQLEQAMK